MGDQFVPYNEALWLKVLGFDEQCMRFYSSKMGGTLVLPERMSNMHNTVNSSVEFLGYCAAPLWQQAFDWFREKKRIDGLVNFDNDPEDEDGDYHYGYEIRNWNTMKVVYNEGWTTDELWRTYFKARQALLEKLIEIAKEENDR